MRKFTLRSFVVLALSMCACTKTDFNGDDGNPQPGSGLVGGGPYYMSFRLEMADGPDTRAGYLDDVSGDQFEYGSEAEYAIQNFMILFFNKDYKQVYHVTSAEQTPTDGQEDIEKEFGKLITISLDSDDDNLGEKLASVTSYVTILNYNPLWDAEDSSFYDLYLYNYYGSTGAFFFLNEFHCGYKYSIEKNDGFVMSTAGHYNDNGSYIYYDTCNAETSPIFYDTASEAKNHPVEITVERLAARVDMDFQPKIEPIEVLYGTDVYELTFNPDRWGLEAEEKDEFIIKNQPPLRDVYNRDENNYPRGYGEWIDYKQHRTFWAESPTFRGGTYAWRGDEYEDVETPSKLSLCYTPFNKLSGLTRTSDDSYAATPFYTTEHTFNVSELNKAETKNPYAVPTSVVVGGWYKATYVTTDEKYPPGETPTSSKSEGDELNLNREGFYIRFIDMERTDEVSDPAKKYQYRLYREKNDKGTNDLYEALLKEQFVIFYLGADDGYYPVNAEIFSNDGKSTALEIFEIANTYANQYTLQLKSNIDESILAGLFYAYYDDSDKQAKYVPLQSSNITEANNLLKKQLGYAQRYWKGHAFFYAPILHYIGNDSPFFGGDSYSYSGLFNYKKNGSGKYEKDSNGNYIVDHKNGEFGVVRNHIYKITVAKISTLGQGIPSGDAIPLPEPRIDHELYQFDLSLKVLPWNQFKYTFDI